MIGIIGAMKVEVENLCSLIGGLKVENHRGRDFYVGTIFGVEVVVVESGVGKVNAAVTSTILMEKYDVNLIINTGIAGGVTGVDVFDLVIGKTLVYHDFDLSPIGYQKGVIPGIGREFTTDEHIRSVCEVIAKRNGVKYVIGNIASGDVFATNANILDGLGLDIQAVEMEGAAIAHTCKIYNKPFISLRIISDILGSKEQTDNYNLVEKKAAEYAIIFVCEIIKNSIDKVTKNIV